MADTIIAASLQVDSGQATESVKSFREQLKQAQYDAIAVADKFGLSSKEAAEAAKKVADLRDRMGDTKALVDAFNPDRKFQVFSTAIRGVTNGFTAMQGVMGLVGSESEDLQKTLLKVQSALAVSEGVNGLLELKDTYKVVKAAVTENIVVKKADAIATKVAAGAQMLFAGAVNTTSTSFKVLKAAIVATGIGALIVGIGFLIEKISSWVSSTDDAEAAQKRLKEAVDNLDRSLNRATRSIQRQTELQIIEMKKLGKSQKEIIEAQNQGRDSEVKALEKYRQDLATAYGSIKGEDEKAEEQRKDLKQKSADALLKIEELRFQQTKSVLEDEANEAEKYRQKEKADSDKAKADKEKRQEEQLQDDIKWSDEQLALREERHKREKDILIREKEEEQELRDELAKEFIEREKQREEAMKNANISSGIAGASPEETKARGELLKELLFSESEIKIAALDDEYKRKFALIAGNEEAEKALKEWYSEEKKRIDDAEVAHKIQNLQKVSGFLGQAAGLFGKHTAAYKVLATTQAIIDTYTSAQAAYKSMVGIPIVGPVLAAAAAGVAIATGLKNIKEINKVQVPGGGGGAMPSISAPAPLQPQPQVGTTQLDQQSLNQMNNATVRAFVVESDVSNNQERVTRLNRAARLGG